MSVIDEDRILKTVENWRFDNPFLNFEENKDHVGIHIIGKHLVQDLDRVCSLTFSL